MDQISKSPRKRKLSLESQSTTSEDSTLTRSSTSGSPESQSTTSEPPILTQFSTSGSPDITPTMAPGYRANNQSRRQNRGYVDHDVFEGLPVRNWRRDTITVAPPPAHENVTQKDKWDVELPWGMPKDSHLLPQHSQDLLRAARSGRLYAKRKAAEEEEADPEAAAAGAAAGTEKPEKKEIVPKEEGFSVKTWKLVPRQQESPEIELLAKRRKVIKGTTAQRNTVSGPPLTKATVRRTDAAGNTYVEDLVVPEGQTVEGEVISQTVINDPSAGEALPVVPTPPRRRPPPPKRKAKGPGRGRKKKLPLPPTSVPAGTDGANGEGQVQADGTTSNAVGPDGEKLEGSATPANENEDTEMGEDSLLQSDEDGEDGEEGDEGDEGDEDEEQEGEGEGEGEDGAEGDIDGQTGETDQDETPERKLDASEADIIPQADAGDDEVTPPLDDNGYPYDPAQSLPGHINAENAALNGSPLKQVMTQSSYPSEFGHPTGDVEMGESIAYENPEGTTLAEETALNAEYSGYTNPPGDIGIQSGFQPIEGQQQQLGHEYQTLQPTGLEQDDVLEGDHIPPFDAEDPTATAAADEHPDEMLLDQVENISAAPIGADIASTTAAEQPTHPDINTLAAPLATPVPAFSQPEAQPLPIDQTLSAPAPESLSATTSAAAAPPAAEEDKFEDLLGSLEDHLDATGTAPATVPEPETSAPPPPAPVPAPAELAEPTVAEPQIPEIATEASAPAETEVAVPEPVATAVPPPVEETSQPAGDNIEKLEDSVGDIQPATTDATPLPIVPAPSEIAPGSEEIPEAVSAVPVPEAPPIADVAASVGGEETGAEAKAEEVE